MTTKELLNIPLETYNAAVRKMHVNPDKCKHCDRLYTIVCICPTAQKEWQDVIDEVREVSEMNNRETEYTEDDAANEIIKELDEIGRDFDDYEFGLPVYDRNCMEVMRNRIKEIIRKTNQ
jgi:hypothetical protein